MGEGKLFGGVETKLLASLNPFEERGIIKLKK